MTRTPVGYPRRMRAARPRPAELAMLVVAGLAAVAAAGLYLRSGSFVLSRIVSTDLHTDFDTFRASAMALLAGGDIYATGASVPNLNPPLLTVLFAPLALLDPGPGYRVLVLVSTVLVVGSLLAVGAELRLPGGRLAAVVAGVLVSSPFLATLGLGQIYPLLTAGLAGSWLAGRHGRPVLAGALLGLVVALKPSLLPVLLLPVLRHVRRGAGAAIGTAVAGSVLGVLVAGPASAAAWLRLVAGRPVETYVDNASLTAALVRLTTRADGLEPLAEVPGGLAAGALLATAVLGLTLWRVRRPPADGGPDAALWALAAAALVASPLTWHNYLVVLVPGVLVLLARGRWPVVVLLVSLTLIGMEWPWFWTVDGTASAVPFSLYAAILLAHWAALCAVSGPAAGEQGRRSAGSPGVRGEERVGDGPHLVGSISWPSWTVVRWAPRPSPGERSTQSGPRSGPG